MNSGLYARAGASEMARAAACAKRFEDPMMKVSKVYRRLRLASAASAAASPRGRSVKYPGQLSWALASASWSSSTSSVSGLVGLAPSITTPSPEPRVSGLSPGSESSGLDHPTLAPNEGPRIRRLAVLVLSEAHGAAVREVDAPAR